MYASTNVLSHDLPSRSLVARATNKSWSVFLTQILKQIKNSTISFPIHKTVILRGKSPCLSVLNVRCDPTTKTKWVTNQSSEEFWTKDDSLWVFRSTISATMLMSKTNSFSRILLLLVGLVLPQERKNHKHEKGTHTNQYATECAFFSACYNRRKMFGQIKRDFKYKNS